MLFHWMHGIVFVAVSCAQYMTTWIVLIPSCMGGLHHGLEIHSIRLSFGSHPTPHVNTLHHVYCDGQCSKVIQYMRASHLAQMNRIHHNEHTMHLHIPWNTCWNTCWDDCETLAETPLWTLVETPKWSIASLNNAWHTNDTLMTWNTAHLCLKHV